VDGVLVTFERQ